MQKFHTIASVAARAEISVPTLMRRFAAGKGPRREYFGGVVAVSEDALAEWIASGQHLDGRRRAA